MMNRMTTMVNHQCIEDLLSLYLLSYNHLDFSLMVNDHVDLSNCPFLPLICILRYKYIQDNQLYFLAGCQDNLADCQGNLSRQLSWLPRQLSWLPRQLSWLPRQLSRLPR